MRRDAKVVAHTTALCQERWERRATAKAGVLDNANAAEGLHQSRHVVVVLDGIADKGNAHCRAVPPRSQRPYTTRSHERGTAEDETQKKQMR
eukprot:2000945-Prymnesium_polylepis.4